MRSVVVVLALLPGFGRIGFDAASTPDAKAVDAREACDIRFGPPVSYASGSRPGAVATGDLDGDARPDVIVALANVNQLNVYLTRTDGTLGVATSVNIQTQSRDVFIVDMDQDGRSDVIATLANNNLCVFSGNGDGT